MIEKFDSFTVEDGKLLGIVGDAKYELEHIICRDGRSTEVTYYDNGETYTITQYEPKKFKDVVEERFPVGDTP